MLIQMIIGPLVSAVIWAGFFVMLDQKIRRLQKAERRLRRMVDGLDLAVGGPSIRVEGGPMEKMGMTHLPPIVRGPLNALDLDYICLPEIDLETGDAEMRNFQHYRKITDGFFRYVGPCREVMGAKHMATFEVDGE